MVAAWLRAATAACIVAWLSGCNLVIPDTSAYVARSGLPPATELESTPFFSDAGRHCGPAALATVLVHSGVATGPANLSPHVFIPGRDGALQAEMKAAARSFGRLPYELPARLDAALRELRAGRPVLVLQKLDDTARGWHYAVLVGYDARADEVVLRSGEEKRHSMSTARFDYTWARAGRWATIVLRPGELPAEADERRYLQAAVAFADRAPPSSREQVWQSAVELWPESLTALLGLAGARYASGDLTGAVFPLERAIAAHPDAADAHNNLAHVLGKKGDRARALAHARRAIALGGARLETYRQTLRELETP